MDIGDQLNEISFELRMEAILVLMIFEVLLCYLNLVNLYIYNYFNKTNVITFRLKLKLFNQ